MNYPKQNELDFLCVLLAGSHLYGLQHSGSDEDHRGVYLNSKKSEVLGLLENNSYTSSDTSSSDFAYYSLSRFFDLLRKTNTNTIEILFAPEYLLVTEDFKRIKEKRNEFIDSSRLVSSVKGYMFSEIRLALGERTGRLGGKRKTALEKYKFSPKNISSLLRIRHCLKEFLKNGEWPCVITGPLKDLSMRLKLHPEEFSLDEIKDLTEAARIEVESMTDTLSMKFNSELAAEIMWDIYKKKFN